MIVQGFRSMLPAVVIATTGCGASSDLGNPYDRGTGGTGGVARAVGHPVSTGGTTGSAGFSGTGGTTPQHDAGSGGTTGGSGGNVLDASTGGAGSGGSGFDGGDTGAAGTGGSLSSGGTDAGDVDCTAGAGPGGTSNGSLDSGTGGTGGSLDAGGATSTGDGSVPDAGIDAEASVDSGGGATTSTGGTGGTDAGVVPVICEGSFACPSEWCEIGCCGGGGSFAGCAFCCLQKGCQQLDVAHCPLDHCQLLPTCDGSSICYYKFSGEPPSCGGVSYYGAEVPCCSGLVKRCGEPLSDGSCAMDAGGYQGIPQCLACGDGYCQTPSENRCNCPEDCP